jgi:hypothetical protein
MNRASKKSLAALLVSTLPTSVGLTACGGDGSGPPRPAAPPPPGATTFRENLARMTPQRDPEPSRPRAFDSTPWS